MPLDFAAYAGLPPTTVSSSCVSGLSRTVIGAHTGPQRLWQASV